MCDETRVKTVQGTIAKVEWSNPKLVKSAGVRALDLYSLRHTFATLLGRTAGESAFNVARMMGHSRSLLVD
jgi:integrase